MTGMAGISVPILRYQSGDYVDESIPDQGTIGSILDLATSGSSVSGLFGGG